MENINVITNKKSHIKKLISSLEADLYFLFNARDSLLTHPKFKISVAETDSAMCRILAITAISTVDKILEYWQGTEFFTEYFDKNNKKISNERRIEILAKCFTDNEIKVDNDILYDYLAIKLLRNGLVHIGWNNNDQISFIEKRVVIHFPIGINGRPGT